MNQFLRRARNGILTVVTAAMVAMNATPGLASRLAPNEFLTVAIVDSLILEQLNPIGNEGEREVRIHAPLLPMANHSSDAAELELKVRRHDRSSGQLEADLIVLFDDGRRHLVEVSAVVHELVAVPVPVVSIDPGQVIEPHHLRFAHVREQSIRESRITDPTTLIGKEARRKLTAGRLIAARDIRHPEQVEEGDAVTIIYERDGLSLQISGRALSDGSAGDPVRARNGESDRIIHGIVDGPGVVRIDNLITMRSAANQ
ncbi:MAG: flagellar basal body P-ring formation chaperone FlgA [Pseudomonadota bacterium]